MAPVAPQTWAAGPQGAICSAPPNLVPLISSCSPSTGWRKDPTAASLNPPQTQGGEGGEQPHQPRYNVKNMQISPWALNYTDYIIITSGGIEGFSKPTPVLKGSVRERLLYRKEKRISMRAPCARRRERGLPAQAAQLGSSPAKSTALPAPRYAGAGRQRCRPSPLFPHPSAHGARRAIQSAVPVECPGVDGLRQLGSGPEIPGSQGIARATGHLQWLTRLPGRAFPRDLQRGGRTTRSRGMRHCRKAPRHTCSPKAPCNLC